MTATQQRCEHIANLVEEARASSAKIMAKEHKPGYRGSSEEMIDLLDWFCENHQETLAAFCQWCRNRRQQAPELCSPAGTVLYVRYPRRVLAPQG